MVLVMFLGCLMQSILLVIDISADFGCFDLLLRQLIFEYSQLIEQKVHIDVHFLGSVGIQFQSSLELKHIALYHVLQLLS